MWQVRKKYYPNFIMFLSMLCVCLLYMATIMNSERIHLAMVTVPVSVIAIVIWFFCINLIAFIYKPKIALNVVVSAFSCELFFVILSMILVHFPSMHHWKHAGDYDLIINPLGLNYFKQLPVLLITSYLNVKIISQLFSKPEWLFVFGAVGNVFVSTLCYSLVIGRNLSFLVTLFFVIIFMPFFRYLVHQLQRYENNYTEAKVAGLQLVK